MRSRETVRFSMPFTPCCARQCGRPADIGPRMDNDALGRGRRICFGMMHWDRGNRKTAWREASGTAAYLDSEALKAKEMKWQKQALEHLSFLSSIEKKG